MCYKRTYALQDGKIIDYPVPYGRSCKDGSNPAEETILGGNAVVLKQSLGTDPSRRLRRRYGKLRWKADGCFQFGRSIARQSENSS
jgi:hypothetical protein